VSSWGVITTLFSDPYLEVTLDDTTGLVRYVRSSAAYPSLDVVRTSHEALLSALPARPRVSLKLLVDTRAAPARNDEAFEKVIQSTLASLLPRFASFAILVKSAVGKLQVSRLAKAQSGQARLVCTTEAEALEHLGIR
jgi:hypothetical protein